MLSHTLRHEKVFVSENKKADEKEKNFLCEKKRQMRGLINEKKLDNESIYNTRQFCEENALLSSFLR
jgi:hypothetical protein